ncbi:hypothetical protein [Spirillospora sp. CA-294931]|uniref:hypothetical protein n=1 Tax=Spirillospora sp. CA-294931 TaxID=3240042 RepID=UPI003D8B84BA
MEVAMRGCVVAAVAAGALVTASGCGEEPARTASSPGPSRPAASPSASASSEVAVTVAVSGGKVRTADGRVKARLGQTVAIVITSDAEDEFHLHGYDRTARLEPGRPATVRLVADKPGVFEAELHHSGARVFELQVG